MQKYIRVAFEARGLDPDFDGPPMCERCEVRRSQDVEHIYGRKGTLMNDPYNLMFICRECHINKGGHNWKKAAELVVEYKIIKRLEKT